MAERKQMHLQDLFRTGKEVKFDLEVEKEDVEIRLWMRKPTPGQQDEAVAKARGKQARRKKILRDEDSDEYLALWGDVETFEDIEQLKEQILRFESQRLRSQAFNEVLHDEDFMPKDDDGKPIYGKDNTQYLDLLTAIQQRMEEIQQFNDDLEDGDESLIKSFDEDEELVELQKDRDAFEEHVTTRTEDLEAEHMKEHDGKNTKQLRKLLLKKLVEADTSLVWYEEYRTWMLYFSCRHIDDKTKAYFTNHREILGIPSGVMVYLEDQLNELDSPGDAVKNLPSLQSS